MHIRENAYALDMDRDSGMAGVDAGGPYPGRGNPVFGKKPERFRLVVLRKGCWFSRSWPRPGLRRMLQRWGSTVRGERLGSAAISLVLFSLVGQGGPLEFLL